MVAILYSKYIGQPRISHNIDDIRTSKTVYGVEHKSHLNGSQITAEMWMSGNTKYFLHYVYDKNGLPIGLQYRTSAYEAGAFDSFYFEKNLQGDIVAVYNSTGKKIGTYTYDVWGNCSQSIFTGTTSLERTKTYSK